MKVLLAYICQYSDRNDYYMSLLPAGLVSIASSLEARGHVVLLANLSSMGWGKGAEYIAGENPQALGLSIFSYNRTDSFKLIREVRKKLSGVKIILGGHHPSFLSSEIIKRYREADHIITGEGEISFSKLLDDIAAGRNPEKIINGARIDDLDKLPPAPEFSGALKDVNVHEQYKYIISSRGCPHKCSFCSSPSFWKRRVEYRSAENIFNEVKYIYEKFGIIYFSIRDDNFTLKKKRVIDFSRLLRKSGIYFMWNCQSRVDTVDEEMLAEMKRAGLEHIQYGVESGSEKILLQYDKSIKIHDIVRAAEITRRTGVNLSFYLMSGMAGETYGDVKKTLSIIRKTLPMDCIISPVAYYPGTELYEEMKKKGRITDDIWFEKNESGIFVREDNETKKWITEISHEIRRVSSISHFSSEDFASHRKFTGDCWVTDIMEGDFCTESGDYKKAGSLYKKVIDGYPDNIWGHYRMGRLNLAAGNHKSAIIQYLKAAAVNPEFYGSWLKLAGIYLFLNEKEKAKECLLKAYNKNRYDLRIKDLLKKLKIDKN